MRNSAGLQPRTHNNRQPLPAPRPAPDAAAHLANRAARRQPSRRLARRPARHVALARSPAAHARSPAVAPAAQPLPRNSHRHAARRRPVACSSCYSVCFGVVVFKGYGPNCFLPFHTYCHFGFALKCIANSAVHFALKGAFC